MTAFVLPNTDNQSLVLALTTKKDEINNQILSLKAEIQRLSGGLIHINATIGLLSGDEMVNTSKKRISRQKLFKPNEYKTMILDILRRSDPISTNNITKTIIKDRNIDLTKATTIQKTVLNSLKAMEKKGIVKSIGKDDLLSYIWRVA